MSSQSQCNVNIILGQQGRRWKNRKHLPYIISNAMSRLHGPQHLRPVPVLPEGDAGGVGGPGRDADHPHRAGEVSGQQGRAARVVKLQYSPAYEC